MKTTVAIVLIIVGGVLVITPLVIDHFNAAEHQANAMKVVESTNLSTENKIFYINQRPPMGVYAYFCLIAGTLMTAMGVWGTLRKSPANNT